MFKVFLTSSLFKLIFKGKGKKRIYLLFETIFFYIIAALLEGVFFTLIIIAISALEGKINLSKLPSFLFKVFNFQSWDNIKWFSFFVIIAVFTQMLKSVLSYIGHICAIKFSTSIQSELQKKIYNKVFKFSYSCVSNYKQGDLIEYSSSPTTAIPGLTESINQSLISFFTCSVLSAFLFSISIKMALIVILSSFTLFFAQKRVIKKISQTSKRLTKLQIDHSKKTAQYLQVLKLIHLYGREKESLENAENNITNIKDITKKLLSLTGVLIPFNEIMSIFLVGICLVAGSFFFTTNTVPTLLTFLTVTYRLSTKSQILMSSIGTIARYSGFVQRMNEVLKDDDKEFIDESGEEFSCFKNKIQFNSINFRYAPNLTSVVKNVTFEISKGQTAAFVGSSGAGKSTLLDLLTRLYEPLSGEILVDGEKLNKFSIKSWRDSLGLVSQESLMLHGTIEENIRFGKLDASDEEIIKASKIAGAFEFILNLPGGFKTIVGERGYRLSGGERQRIALARALVRKPQILILDEATSNLDSHSEYFIQKALEKLQHKITIIVVAHRLSTITKSDQIFLIDNGEIAEVGSHEELIASKGKYNSFWEIQSKGKLCVES